MAAAWLAVALTCALLQGLVADPMALAWDRAAVVRQHAIWRLWSGPFIHLSWTHLALNLAGLGALLALFERLLPPFAQCARLLAIALLTTSILQLAFPHAQWMVGLSGPLHGLFAALSIRLLATPDPAPRQAWWRGPMIAWALLGGLALKLALEATLAPDPSQAAWLGGPVLRAAHQAGTIAGVMVGLVDAARLRSMQRLRR